MTSKYLIYALVDPRDGAWRYIGKSSSGLRRPKSHSTPANLKLDSHTYKGRWVNLLGALRLRPECLVLEELVGHEGLPAAEMEWIAEARRQGVRLTNLTDGGEGAIGNKQSPETIEKRIGPLRGRKFSPERCAEMSKRMKGRRIREDVKVKISLSLTGLKQSEETKEKRAAKSRFRPNLKLSKRKKPKPVTWRTKCGGYRAGAPKGRPVIDTAGTTYVSVGAAARAVGVDRALIRRVIQGKQLSARGLGFRFVETEC